jgi:hypothetical protein
MKTIEPKKSATRHPKNQQIDLDKLAWSEIFEALSENGFALTERILTSEQCSEAISWFAEEDRFRSTINMQQHRFGRGIYKYFRYPLPEVVEHLRQSAYEHLVPIANTWNEALNLSFRYPQEHEAFLEVCHKQEQRRPTPLILKYEPGDYNCLHQDLYGEVLFPIQMAILLSQPGSDFAGGEFILSEQRPRSQSKVEVVPLEQGQAVIFAVNHRPQRGGRGIYKVSLKHGVSRLRAGKRYTLGIIFHDAK